MVKESLNLLFDLEMQAIGLLVLIVPFLALYYRNFLHWKNAPGHFHRDSPLKSPGAVHPRSLPLVLAFAWRHGTTGGPLCQRVYNGPGRPVGTECDMWAAWERTCGGDRN